MKEYQHLIEVLTLASIAFFEFSVVVNIATAFEDNASLSQEYLSMESAPDKDHWRAIDIPYLGYFAAALALLAHLTTSGLVTLGAWSLHRSEGPSEIQRAISTTTLGLSVGILFYLLFFIAMGGWLRISFHEYSFTENAIQLAILYGVIGGFLHLRHREIDR